MPKFKTSEPKQKEAEMQKAKDKKHAEIVVRDGKRYLVTPNGTNLPLLQLKGKDYLQIAHRLVWMREEHPNWQIITKPLDINVDKKYAIFRSAILDENGTTMATATKAESVAGFADYIEKSETGSIGRCCSLVGYGTQFAPELDEGERIVDSPVEVPKRSLVNPMIFSQKTLINHEDMICKHCQGNNLTKALTKANNPRNPSRPYWKCLDCPLEKNFSHWVEEVSSVKSNEQ